VHSVCVSPGPVYNVRMESESARSEAASRLAQARWGHTKVRRLVRELAEYRGDLNGEELAELRELVDAADTHEETA